MAIVYDYEESTITLWKDGQVEKTIPFNSGDYDFPKEVAILLNFKQGTLSLQEAYHLLKHDPSLYFVE